MSTRKGAGRPGRPQGYLNRGRGKQLPLDQAADPIPEQPRNRRERRALAAWQRKQGDQERYAWGGSAADRFDCSRLVGDAFERGWTDNHGQRWHKPPYQPARPCGPTLTKRPRRARLRAAVWIGLGVWCLVAAYLAVRVAVWIGGGV